MIFLTLINFIVKDSATYGTANGNRILCALKRDDPVKTCG